jgi:hypothetical protein
MTKPFQKLHRYAPYTSLSAISPNRIYSLKLQPANRQAQATPLPNHVPILRTRTVRLISHHTTQEPGTNVQTRQNDSRLDELASKVSALRGITVDIYDSARDQHVIDSTVCHESFLTLYSSFPNPAPQIFPHYRSHNYHSPSCTLAQPSSSLHTSILPSSSSSSYMLPIPIVKKSTLIRSPQ